MPRMGAHLVIVGSAQVFTPSSCRPREDAELLDAMSQ
jgi:hypothetical protein